MYNFVGPNTIANGGSQIEGSSAQNYLLTDYVSEGDFSAFADTSAYDPVASDITGNTVFHCGA